METELLQSLEDVGFTGPLLEPTRFSQALQGGPNSPDFTNLVSWLTDQIGFFGKIEETVHPTSSPEDASHFMTELSIFLKELGCVNTKLTTGNVNNRLASMEDKSILLDYLISELMANKMLETKKPVDNKALEITISESITARTLREMLTALRFQKPPDNIAPDLLFKKLEAKIAEILKQVPKDLVGKPMFFGELSNEQWQKLDKVQGDLSEEYTIRREMLLKRLDVTVQSFSWSERIRPKEDELNRCYNVKRDAMHREPDVTLAHLLSARDDLAIIEKTSNASVRKNTRSSINKVIIGAVPDRGGRPCEQEPPPPEMPSWQKDRVQGPQRGGFGGGDRGGGRGGGGRGGGRGGNQAGGGGGYRDNKSAANNFGQNFDSQKQFSNYGGSQGGGYDNKNPSYSNQSSGYSNNQGSGYGNKSYNNQSGYASSQSSSGYSGQSSGYSSGSSNYSNQSSYNNQSSYGNQSSGYGGQSGYSSQGSNYGNQGSSYNNQGSNYSNQGGYDRKSGGGDYQKGGQGRGGRVQGGWNQGGGGGGGSGGGGYNNRNQGQGGRRY